MNPAIAMLNTSRMFEAAKAKVAEVQRTCADPQTALQYLMKQNPNVQRALEYVNANGGDPRAAYEKLAREKGMI